jgi:hypothetical protein
LTDKTLAGNRFSGQDLPAPSANVLYSFIPYTTLFNLSGKIVEIEVSFENQ